MSEEEKDDLCSEEKQMNTEQADAEGIHIMTIHKSKGLEFPYVFVHMDNDKCPKLGNQTDFNSLEEDVRLADEILKILREPALATDLSAKGKTRAADFSEEAYINNCLEFFS